MAPSERSPESTSTDYASLLLQVGHLVSSVNVEVDPADIGQLMCIQDAVNSCTAIADSFLRMGQDGYGVPAHYTAPQMESLFGEEVPVMDPFLQSIYHVGSIYTVDGWKTVKESLHPAVLNEVFAAANRLFAAAFDPTAFNAFVEAQPPEVAAAIRDMGSRFIWHWSENLVKHSADPELIKTFMGSPLFRQLYPRADEVGNSLMSRLTAHVVRLEGAGSVDDPTPAYQELLRHTAEQIARGSDTSEGLGLIAWHTPAEISGLLANQSDPGALRHYGSWAMAGLLSRVELGESAAHLMVLAELSRPLLETPDGCAGLLSTYANYAVTPPAELVEKAKGYLADPQVFDGVEGSYNHLMRLHLQELVADCSVDGDPL